MKITIEFQEGNELIPLNGWSVTHGRKSAQGLGYDEMLGLVAAITMPAKRPCLQWLKTKQEWNNWNKKYNAK
jgi:hypothetical protein